MDYAKSASSLRDMEARLRTTLFAVVLLSVALFLSVIALLKVIGTERTVVVPPSLNKTFWITNDRASAEYLEQMAGFMTWLVLDVSVHTMEWKKQTLLSYVPPDKAGAMKTRMELEADRLKALNAATYFLPRHFTPDEATQAVVVRGILRTQINGVDTSNVEKAYLVGFEQSGGRIHLKEMTEVTDEK